MKKIILCGSIAYDYIMDYDGYFKDSIIAANNDNLSVSFLANDRELFLGGVAPNIAYSLVLLKEKVMIVGAVGSDFKKYQKYLEDIGVDLSGVEISDKDLTPAAYILTDKNENQITIFSPSAMKNENLAMSLPELANDTDYLGVISADMPKRMVALAKSFLERNLEYIFDPGQGISSLTSEQLKFLAENSMGMILNDYEFQLFEKKTGIIRANLLSELEFLVITYGAEGSKAFTIDREFSSKSIKVETVKDVTGCGDAFRSGFLSAYIGGKDLQECLYFGSTAASFAVENIGTQSHSYDLETFMKRLEAAFS